MPRNLEISLQIDGIDKLIQRLGRSAASETLRAPLERAMERLRSRLATYPPPRPAQTYQRTGNLGRGWKTQLGGLDATLTNRVRYGPFVQGDKTQARMHRGRWLTDQQAVDQEAPNIEADFQQSIDKALGQH